MQTLEQLNESLQQHEMNYVLLRSEGEYEAAQFEEAIIQDIEDEIMAFEVDEYKKWRGTNS